MTNVLLPNEFDISNVSLSAPKKNSMGGLNILINYNGGPLILQTPKMRAPFGVDEGEGDSGTKKYSINTSLAGSAPKESYDQLTSIFNQIDEYVKNEAIKNSEEWFGKKKSKDVVDELFKFTEKKPKVEGKYPSTIKIKLPHSTKDSKALFSLYDDKKKQIEFDLSDCIPIEKGCELVTIIQCTGIWFVGKTSFGIGYKALSIKKYSNAKLTGYAFVDDSDEEEEEIEDPEPE